MFPAESTTAAQDEDEAALQFVGAFTRRRRTAARSNRVAPPRVSRGRRAQLARRRRDRPRVDEIRTSLPYSTQRRGGIDIGSTQLVAELVKVSTDDTAPMKPRRSRSARFIVVKLRHGIGLLFTIEFDVKTLEWPFSAPSRVDYSPWNARWVSPARRRRAHNANRGGQVAWASSSRARRARSRGGAGRSALTSRRARARRRYSSIVGRRERRRGVVAWRAGRRRSARELGRRDCVRFGAYARRVATPLHTGAQRRSGGAVRDEEADRRKGRSGCSPQQCARVAAGRRPQKHGR